MPTRFNVGRDPLGRPPVAEGARHRLPRARRSRSCARTSARRCPRPSGLAAENLQARIRGVIVMTLSNQHGWLVLTTSQQVRDGRRLLDALRRHGRRLRADQGRAEDDASSPSPAGSTSAPGARSIPQSIIDRPPQRRAARRPARRPVAAALRRARPDPRGLRRATTCSPAEIAARRHRRPRARASASRAWSTARSTSGGRRRRASSCTRRRSGAIGACRSRIATARRRVLRRGASRSLASTTGSERRVSGARSRRPRRSLLRRSLESYPSSGQGTASDSTVLLCCSGSRSPAAVASLLVDKPTLLRRCGAGLAHTSITGSASRQAPSALWI